MPYFLDTVETIPPGMGFPAFGPCHLLWLAAFLLFAAGCSLLYRSSPEPRRFKIRKIFAALLLADELWKWVWLMVGGTVLPKYLPLHLCSINIFVIAIHAVKPSKTLGNLLYTACLPGAVAALLFPTWTSLPVANFMHLHSFTIHILLATYPLMLTMGGDIKPELRQIPKALGLLAAMAVPIYFINLLLDTNFMFLMHPEPGNPLYWFEAAFGSHLLGFLVLIPLVLLVMYAPVLLAAKRNTKQPVPR